MYVFMYILACIRFIYMRIFMYICRFSASFARSFAVCLSIPLSILYLCRSVVHSDNSYSFCKQASFLNFICRYILYICTYWDKCTHTFIPICISLVFLSGSFSDPAVSCIHFVCIHYACKFIFICICIYIYVDMYTYIYLRKYIYVYTYV